MCRKWVREGKREDKDREAADAEVQGSRGEGNRGKYCPCKDVHSRGTSGSKITGINGERSVP